MRTAVTELLGIDVPIIQGGLAYLAYAELAAAVSNAGGLGQITAMSLPSTEDLLAEIHKVRRLTDRPFGVNFAIGQHGRPFEERLRAVLQEGVEIVSVTGGNPRPFFECIRRDALKPVKTLVLVSSVRHAQKAESLGADAVMVVGQEGGGHLGRDDTSTMVLIPKVADSVSVPVIASGGIGDGRGLMAALALGAEGVEMGTRFIATRECVHAHESYKRRLLEAEETDTLVIKRSLGTPGRVIHTPFAEKILETERRAENDGEKERFAQLQPLISGERNRKFIYEGRAEEGFGWAGQVTGLIEDVPSVAELFSRMLKQAKAIEEKWSRRLRED